MVIFCSILGGLFGKDGYFAVRSFIALDKAFNIAKNKKYDGYQSIFASLVHVFDKKSALHTKKIGINSD